ncbi:MAG: hypothetical protein K8U03_09260 [Planctomycetia bacterium]|nr:hypothetical protein [Planctomycetia bacterium]
MLTTLLDIAKRNGSDALVGLIDETSKSNVEMTGMDLSSGRKFANVGAARTIAGRLYKTLVRTALGNTAGSFRSANEGSTSVKHTYENRIVETYILEPRFECDKAVADSDEDGPEAFLANEAQGTLEGELQALCRAFYYGYNATFGNSKAFPGLLQAYDSTNMLVDATGSTANTASSVWAVKFGPQNVQWVMGENGKFELNPVRVESLTDPADATKRFDGYVQTMQAYPGLQVGSLQSVARIKNLTEQTGKMLTDTLLSQLLEKFPTRIKPDVIFLSRRSLGQLRRSRTATTETGKEAPLPQDYDGIPLVPSDAISNIESIDL